MVAPPRALRVGLLAALALFALGCNDAKSSPPSAGTGAAPPAPPAITTVHPEVATRETALETTGKAQFNEEQMVRVQAPATGRVAEVLARPGDAVASGQRLFVLDSADLGSAKSDYAKASADVERAEKAMTLARELVEAKALAQKDLREAENDHRKGVAERERAAARLRTLGVTPEQLPGIASRADASTRIVVAAPRGGVLVERNVAPGQVVSFGQSDTPVNLFVIADLSTMWIVADVYEPDVARVRVGQAVSVTLPCCPGDRYEGRLTYVSDLVDKETRTVKVRAVVPNRGRQLKAEMFVKATIHLGAASMLTIPQSAVHREEGAPFVLVETGKESYARRRVKLGAELDGVVEVVDGVTPADAVVSAGSILLKKTAQ